MIRKIALAVIASTAFAGAAFAQTSNVNLGFMTQSQSGLLNNQSAAIGTVYGTGTSNVNAGFITQNQSGLLNSQSMTVGTAVNGTSNVNVGFVTQDQSGLLNSQSLDIGSVQ